MCISNKFFSLILLFYCLLVTFFQITMWKFNFRFNLLYIVKNRRLWLNIIISFFLFHRLLLKMVFYQLWLPRSNNFRLLGAFFKNFFYPLKWPGSPTLIIIYRNKSVLLFYVYYGLRRKRTPKFESYTRSDILKNWTITD